MICSFPYKKRHAKIKFLVYITIDELTGSDVGQKKADQPFPGRIRVGKCCLYKCFRNGMTFSVIVLVVNNVFLFIRVLMMLCVEVDNRVALS